MAANISSNPGIYLHIPFCQKKCPYCDFYSVVDSEYRDHFVDDILKEIALIAGSVKQKAPFDTIYFGGGTPSLLTVREIETILNALYHTFSFSATVEITLEANPGTIDLPRLKAYRQTGINRLSLGIQSFINRELQFLGRIHDRQEAIQAIEMARQAGFRNLSLDLIFALPGQSKNDWLENLRMALSFHPEHLSAYNLIFEQGTPFFNRMKAGKIIPKNPDDEARFFEATVEYLREAGFLPYEISNYARNEQFISRHNYKYWTHTPYLGLGPAAHSYWDEERRGNVRSVKQYHQMVQNRRLPRVFSERIDAHTREFEHIFLGLRTYNGIDLAMFEQQFRHSFLNRYETIITPLLDHNLAEQKRDHFRLTQKGLFISDEILSQFWADPHV